MLRRVEGVNWGRVRGRGKGVLVGVGRVVKALGVGREEAEGLMRAGEGSGSEMYVEGGRV